MTTSNDTHPEAMMITGAQATVLANLLNTHSALTAEPDAKVELFCDGLLTAVIHSRAGSACFSVEADGETIM